jgi:hypothetical protein
MEVREWRKARQLLVLFKGAGGVESGVVVAHDGPAAGTDGLPDAVSTATGSSDGVGEVTASSVEQIAATSPTPHITDTEAALVERDHMLNLRKLWLLERIRIIGERGFITTLQAEWPDACAGPKAVRNGDTTWNIAETAAVVKCVDIVEMAHDLPFGATDPELLQRMKLEETERLVKAATGAGLTNKTAN